MVGDPHRHTVVVIGGGAMGTLLAHGLATAGHCVAVVDRAPRVRQIRREGLRVVRDGREASVAVAAYDDPTDAAVAEIVFLATKAHHLPSVAPKLTTCLGRDTAVVTVQNGIPWWYFLGIDGPHAGRRL